MEVAVDAEYIRQLVSRFPRISLAYLPTPLYDAARLTGVLGGPRIYIKRDDLTGLALGGNKPRKLEFLLEDALSQGADCVILSAAAQSNMVRITAAAAVRLGMDAYLVLRSVSEREPIQGNLLLSHLFGAHVTLIPTKDPYSQLSIDTMEQIAEELRAQGRNPYTIDLRYQSAPLAAMGYVLAASELDDQIAMLDDRPTHVFVAVGSGTTQAGLLLGSTLLGSSYQVVGISVQKPAEWILPRIQDKVAGAAELLGVQNPVGVEQILVDDRWIGVEYGVPSLDGIEALKLVARTEGIVLDPAYSAKAMAGLIGWIREGRLGKGDVAVFVHTGGTPALFAWADTIASHLMDVQFKGSGE